MTHNLSRRGLFKTDQPPCCLRIHPLDTSIVYFGTYTLIEGTKRNGSIEVWKLNENHDNAKEDKPDENEINAENLPLVGTKLNTISTHGAVLDIKVDMKSVSGGRILISTAHSTGNISFWNIDNDDSSKLVQVADIQVFPESTNSADETLITSINFHPRFNKLAFTTTTGNVGYYDYTNCSKTPTDEELIILNGEHSLEAWYADWCNLPSLENVVFSGGDDAKLIAHDIRQDMPIMETNRIHDAGIVSILTARDNWCQNVTDPYVIWTGGYDDQLCVLDLRAGLNMGGDLFPGMPPIVREKHNLGGGVWRLIPSPNENDNRIMTCNMYDGGRLISYDEASATNINVVGRFKGDHTSITYGGDWVDDRMVSCSFYDNVVQIWKA